MKTLAGLCKFIVGKRNGYANSVPKPIKKENVVFLKSKIAGISSTEIRTRLHNSKTIGPLIPVETKKLLANSKLYE